MIPVELLEDGRAYLVQARNFPVAVWQAETQDFVGLAWTFGTEVLEHERHWDADDTYGTVRPLEALPARDGRPQGHEDLLDYLLAVETRPTVTPDTTQQLRERLRTADQNPAADH